VVIEGNFILIVLEGYFDGSVKNNKAVYTWIYTIEKYKQKRLLKTKSGWGYCFNINSYEAEYLGLISLLDYIYHNEQCTVERILIKGDCKSVFVTINPNRYKLRKSFNEYILFARELKNKLHLKHSIPIEFNWVPRNGNKLADNLCKSAWIKIDKHLSLN